MSVSRPRRSGPLVRALVGLLILLLLVVLDDLLVRQLLHRGYFSLWRDHGPTITVTFTILSLVWTDLDNEHRDLVSAHPLRFVGACAAILQGFLVAMINSIPTGYFWAATPGLSIRETSRRWGWTWGSHIRVMLALVDALVAAGVLFILFLVALAWFLILAPGVYFLTLLTGAPARLALLTSAIHGPRHALGLDPSEEGQTAKRETLRTLSSRPVTLTAAITTLLFGVVRLVTQ